MAYNRLLRLLRFRIVVFYPEMAQYHSVDCITFKSDLANGPFNMGWKWTIDKLSVKVHNRYQSDFTIHVGRFLPRNGSITVYRLYYACIVIGPIRMGAAVSCVRFEIDRALHHGTYWTKWRQSRLTQAR